MHKLVILIEPLDDWDAFEEAWPAFLHLVESMPALRREAISRVDAFLYGETPYAQMHELFFENLKSAQESMASEQGRAAGKLLQAMTGGRMALFFADHKEDDLENIQTHIQKQRAKKNMDAEENLIT
jgi:uncharacterized protein (TIGR02118 family)